MSDAFIRLYGDDAAELPIHEVISLIVSKTEAIATFWGDGGWAPTSAAKLLSKSRLDWQVSLARTLTLWVPPAVSPQSPDEAGRLILGGVIGFGVLLAAFALSRWFSLSLVLLVFVGYFHTLHLTSAQVVLQTMVPDELRGRVMGLNGMLWSLMPLGGGLLNGTAHFVGGADRALVGGAVVVLLYVALVAARSPSFRGLRLEGLAERPSHAPAVDSSRPPAAP